ncbi:FAD:protein FMN transferase [Tannockella kyphosi]|uniref:FAD:protein FMN transferase n=1 Tax=Tannockella kyphosi TaxID=2899121 RepID=UPI002011522D|nr:FAD:protein FMN transferase [Tannockella kyphosi]
MRKINIILLCLITIHLTGCSQSDPISKSAFLLDTIITIQIYDSDDESLLDGAIDICAYYESLWSQSIETSEVSILNNANGNTVSLSDETIYLLQTAIEYSQLTNGMFDITVKPLSDLWDFTGEDPSVPSQEEIEEAITLVDYTCIQIEGNDVTLLNSQASIELGALAKGYISDQIKIYLQDNGVTSAIINLGGNILTIGQNTDKNNFNIAIQVPFEENEMIGYLEINDLSVVTSGIYERYFESNDTIYHHILDPYTGYPIDNDLLSVTIICDNSLQADVLSTVCLSLGLNQAITLIESLDNVEAIFIDKDYQITQTNENLLKYS